MVDEGEDEDEEADGLPVTRGRSYEGKEWRNSTHVWMHSKFDMFWKERNRL
jgi:hypothetical protein